MWRRPAGLGGQSNTWLGDVDRRGSVAGPAGIVVQLGLDLLDDLLATSRDHLLDPKWCNVEYQYIILVSLDAIRKQ